MTEKNNLPISLIGSGALSEGIKELSSLGYKKVFVVISDTLYNEDISKVLLEEFNKNNLGYHIFNKKNIEARLEFIEEGIDRVIDEKCDVILSFGGRDTTMCARGIAMSLNCKVDEYKISCYIGDDLPFVSVVINSWINDDNATYVVKDQKVKLNRSINPFMVVIDSELVRKLPKNVMASVGVDSLTHSVEALVSEGATQASDAFAYHAIEVLSQNLENFIVGDSSKELREQITYANYLANMAFSNIKVNEKSTSRKDGFSSPAFDLENIDTKMSKVAEKMGVSLDGDELKLGITSEIQRISGLIDIESSSRTKEKIIYNK